MLWAAQVLTQRTLAAGATEIVAVYFENPLCRPGIMNLAVRKGLWPYMQKYVAALRAHTGAARSFANTRADQARPWFWAFLP